jgi:hypothetical protein
MKWIFFQFTRPFQPITKMSTRNFPGGKKRPAHRANNLAAIYEPNVWKMWQPQPLATLRASKACTGITLPYLINSARGRYFLVGWLQDVTHLPVQLVRQFAEGSAKVTLYIKFYHLCVRASQPCLNNRLLTIYKSQDYVALILKASLQQYKQHQLRGRIEIYTDFPQKCRTGN